MRLKMDNKEKKVAENEFEDAGIDKEMLDIIAKDNILSSIKDQTQLNRVEVNFQAETLRELKELSKALDKIDNLLNVVSADKLEAFFKETTENFKKEQEKVNKSKKNSPKKTTKVQ